MPPARPLRDVFADLTGGSSAPGDSQEELLAAAGHPDLPGELAAEAVVNFADTAPVEVAEHLAQFVMAHSPVPLDPALRADLDPAAGVDPGGWLDAFAGAPVSIDADHAGALDPTNTVDHGATAGDGAAGHLGALGHGAVDHGAVDHGALEPAGAAGLSDPVGDLDFGHGAATLEPAGGQAPAVAFSADSTSDPGDGQHAEGFADADPALLDSYPEGGSYPDSDSYPDSGSYPEGSGDLDEAGRPDGADHDGDPDQHDPAGLDGL